MNINHFNSPSKDPLEALVLKYFKQLPSDAKKLEVIAMIQKLASDTTEE